MSTYTVERLSFQHLSELPTAWTNTDYLALLKQLDYDNPEALAPAELKEMCQMALTELEPAAAAEVVLTYLMADELTTGQLEQLAHQMETEKLWEENPELRLHPAFFNATQLLYTAYNGKFPHPQAVEFKVKITAPTPEDLAVLDPEPAVPLLRLLAQGLSDHALVHRLFSEQLAGGEFPSAPLILWQRTPSDKTADSVTFDVISSDYWLEEFKYADTYEATLPAA
ncbi:hypothetical protein E4631_05775 [Hymenobacter sp. UV11]|uniref:hypothetical protein n=1 Tax=Hymenobacter sp. UV11 TaxID=1849735 RepID=UPI00105ED914|nr:hypothetical protein [Hymenobacter sp. UV11]TDN39940.1 hypothetical protein A8B98_16325 [Hymenobacter sp. UV11]TFZ67489.1 hypothetical protein E4631_05775 [Hymenobacter sp. UV11]